MQGRPERLKAIKNLVSEKRISTQEELTKELERIGYDVAQATVSRDMADLGLVKVKRGQGSFYSFPDIERLRAMLKTFWQKVDWSSNLVVLKTAPGTAQGVAAAVDALGWTGVVGTVGGDDTTLIVARDEAAREAIISRLKALYEE
ncbi:MAG: arginine repressor [Actinobacteria bacterium]|nr:arginine repressor [Actinomycetota bacterium]